MYVAVKGGEKAIAAAHALLARERRGDVQIPEVTLEQLAGQLKLAVDRIMAEGSLYSPELAALAFKQAQGDAVEAIFLLRAYRTTLPRFGVSEPMDTSRMRVERRISATWKDLPGGQILGSTFDYTHRLLDRGLAVPGTAPRDVEPERTAEDLAMMAADAQALLQEPLPRAMDALGREGLMESVAPSHEGNDCPDITRQPLELPADGSGDRAVRLQSMARADEGFLLGMAYSTQRGYGAVHPFTGELRRGFVELTVIPEELGFAITLGEVELTECDMVSRYTIQALQDVNFDVRAGECVALHGPSGAGKSTLLKTLYGNYLPSSGQVIVRCEDCETDMATASTRAISRVRRECIGYVSQFLRVIPRVSALDLVAEPLLDAGEDRETALDAAQKMLTRLNLPERLWHVAPATFSGGEQQRVNIARGLIRPMPLLLLDEPTASLDGINRQVVIDLIHEARQRGSAIVGIFHDDVARNAVADRIVPMDRP